MAIKSNQDQVAPITTEFKLPSCGLLYEGFGPIVEIKPYSFDTERFLVTNLTGSEKMLRIASQCVSLPATVSMESLLLNDVLTILAVARGLTYGESYSFKSICPECDFKESHVVRVPHDLPVKTWEQYETREDLERAMEFTLPHIKDRIRFKIFTMADEREVNRAASASAAASRVSIEEERYLTRLAHHLVSVNGGTPDSLVEAREYIRRLSGPDMMAYDDGIDALRCGLIFSWRVVCGGAQCSHQYEATVPMSGSFFRRD